MPLNANRRISVTGMAEIGRLAGLSCSRRSCAKVPRPPTSTWRISLSGGSGVRLILAHLRPRAGLSYNRSAQTAMQRYPRRLTFLGHARPSTAETTLAFQSAA
jgi:hypothetical protein